MKTEALGWTRFLAKFWPQGVLCKAPTLQDCQNIAVTWHGPHPADEEGEMVNLFIALQ